MFIYFIFSIFYFNFLYLVICQMFTYEKAQQVDQQRKEAQCTLVRERSFLTIIVCFNKDRQLLEVCLCSCFFSLFMFVYFILFCFFLLLFFLFVIFVLVCLFFTFFFLKKKKKPKIRFNCD